MTKQNRFLSGLCLKSSLLRLEACFSIIHFDTQPYILMDYKFLTRAYSIALVCLGICAFSLIGAGSHTISLANKQNQVLLASSFFFILTSILCYTYTLYSSLSKLIKFMLFSALGCTSVFLSYFIYYIFQFNSAGGKIPYIISIILFLLDVVTILLIRRIMVDQKNV